MPGQFVADGVKNDASRCKLCTAETYSDTENAGSCTPCASGRYQLEGGKSFCDEKVKCVPGQFVADGAKNDASRCKLCAAGQFSTTQNAVQCDACPSSTYQPKAGKSFCLPHAMCAKGEHESSAPSATSNRGCSPCEAGTFSTATNAASCEACPSGKYQDLIGQPFCEAKQPCAPGTFDANTTDVSSARCKPCPAGFWCQDGKQQQCGSANLFCPPQSKTPTAVAIGHYSVPTNSSKVKRTGQVPCEPGYTCAEGSRKACPAGRLCQLGFATARVGGVDVNVTTETLCESNEFVFRDRCLPCAERGANCINGQITLKPDFWYDSQHGALTEFWGKRELDEVSETLGIYRCAPGSCKLDAESGMPSCTEGRQGLLCGICKNGYYATDISGCEPCPDGANSTAEAVALCIFLMALAAAAWLAKRKIEVRHPKLAASIAEKLPEVLKLLTGLFQILGAFSTVLYRVQWPAAFRAITDFTGVLALDVFSLPSLRCSNLGNTFYGRFNLHMTSMLVITGLFIALLVYAYSRHNQSRVRPLPTSLIWNIFLPFLFLIYPSISKTAILMLRCRDVDGASYLLSDIALSCETAEYARHKAYAIFGVLVFPIGIAVFFTALVGYNRKRLPPDWWPARAPEESRIAYQKYRAKRTQPKPFAAWQIEYW